MARSSTRLSNGLDLGALGERIRLERLQRRLTLDELAARTGVSRSMLSAVERGAKVPTVVVLDRIAVGLETSVARLLSDERSARVLLLRRKEQDVARAPAGWERRTLGPALPGVGFEFLRTTIGPGAGAGAFAPHALGSREYVAVERGTLLLTLDGVAYTLQPGDSISYAGDCVHAFANPGGEPCLYYLALLATGDPALVKHRAWTPAKGRGAT